VANGERRIVTPQAHYYGGPVGIVAEYVWSRQRVSRGDVTGRVVAEAWQVAGSAVWGGKPAYDGVKVDRPFSLAHRTWGALEVAARCGALRIHDSPYRLGFANPRSSPDRASEWVVGLGWHFATLISWKMELSRTRFRWHDVPSARPDETVLLGQVQVASP
jgi:phosphate-selective porin OprO/OprP